MPIKLPNVEAKYGAPMGRADTPHAYDEFQAIPDHPHKFSLQRVKMCSCCGAYDTGGAYWGLGPPLYYAENQTGTITRYFRANSRNEAKAEIRAEFPNAKFYR